MDKAEKTQCVRLVDVFILGPFMMHYAWKGPQLPLAREMLWLSGLLTVVYNGWNYLINVGTRLPPLPL